MQQLYEQVHYPPFTHSQTHPDRLAVVGRLMGLRPANPEDCRVLDIGCGNGANVIAMAELLPGSRFTGIDYAPSQIEEGRQIVRDLGLQNVDLQVADVLELQEAIGPYDYVIAHGFYSWVPEPVRRNVLRLIKQCLAPEGIAFVSFNAYPGWYHIQPLRDMMLYRIRGIDDPAERVRKAREIVQLVADVQDENSVFGLFVRQYANTFHARGPMPEEQLIPTLIHDELAEINQPFYFTEFAAHARDAGLEVLVEADLEGSTPVGISPKLQEELKSLTGSHVEMEQYVDFIRNRGFRRVLLCHPEAPFSRRLDAGPGVLAGMYAGAFLKEEEPEDAQPGAVRFVAADGLTITTDRPVMQAAYRRLTEIYPDVLRFEAIVAFAAEATATPPEEAASTLAASFLRDFLIGRSLLQLHVAPRSLVTEVSDRPRATAFARYMAVHDIGDVPNVRHERVRLPEKARRLIPLLDGEHDLPALAAATSFSEEDLRVELDWLARVAMLTA